MLAAIVSVAGVIRLAAPAIDATQSARPIAEIIRSYSRESFSHESFSFERVPVALYHVGRTKQYGLDFSLNRPTQTYDEGQVPGAANFRRSPERGGRVQRAYTGPQSVILNESSRAEAGNILDRKEMTSYAVAALSSQLSAVSKLVLSIGGTRIDLSQVNRGSRKLRADS